MTTKRPYPPPPPDDAPWLKDFIPLPSNPADLTIDHARAAFAGDWTALRDIVTLAKEVKRKTAAEKVA